MVPKYVTVQLDVELLSWLKCVWKVSLAVRDWGLQEQSPVSFQNCSMVLKKKKKCIKQVEGWAPGRPNAHCQLLPPVVRFHCW